MALFDPTPEDRADFVVRLLEDHIRTAKQESLRGMSFTMWQQIARTEIANAIVDSERRIRTSERIRLYLVITLASAMVTIGFWGVVVSRTDAFNMVAAVIMGLAGLVVMGVVVGMLSSVAAKRWEAQNRRRDWARVKDLSRRIHILRLKLEKEEEMLEEELARTVAKPNPPPS